MTRSRKKKEEKMQQQEGELEAAQQETASFRVAVRTLVEFSHFSPDILPSSDGFSLMWRGTKAHKARQKEQEGETEYSVSGSRECLGEQVFVYGRIDAFTPGKIPFIEEMKLGQGYVAQSAAATVHRAQAVVYAALVALQEDANAVRFAVTYVSESGEVQKVFEEQLSKEQLLKELDELLLPYMAFQIEERDQQAARNESIARLPFPFLDYREGQREMAAQVYTAVVRRKRLFASLPTGTGKSAAVLFPAIKALGLKKTEKLLYLTARNTARQSPLNTLEKMLEQGLYIRAMTLSAKEKLCPGFARCHPEDCPRAKGHFIRQQLAVQVMQKHPGIWTDECILAMAEEHQLCPHEFALALTEIADVVLMDLNYAFDPFSQIKRLFLVRKDMTLLADEAHHIVERVRENFSGELDSDILREMRARFSKAAGRKHPYYRALGETIAAVRQVSWGAADSMPKEAVLKELPETVLISAERLFEASLMLMKNPVSSGEVMADVSNVTRLCLAFSQAAQRLDEDYAILATARGKERRIELYCLLPAKEIARVTKRLYGSIFFSATLSPLEAEKELLGGGKEDACFSLPSPFPAENLRVLRESVSTRYQEREESAQQVAECICEAACSRSGKYIAYFPSYAYLRMIKCHLEQMETPPLWVQESEMDEAARERFLEAFTMDETPKLGLCVLGSLFSEGIDLPGEQLIGVMIVGVGLPVPSLRLKMVQACYGKYFGNGFAYACRIPGMQKVLQAAGRVIRSETDKGLVLLLDDRYFQRDYETLLPREWQLFSGSAREGIQLWKKEAEC